MNELPAPDPRRMTLREAHDRYVRHELEKFCGGAYRQQMRIALNHWERLTNNPPLAEITNQTLDDFQTAYLALGWTNRTFNNYWRSIRRILRRVGPQMYRNPQGEGLIDRVPYIRMLPEEREVPRVVSEDELGRLYDACGAACWPQTVIPPADWWRTLIVLAYNLGIRRGDLQRLAPSNFDLQRRTVGWRVKKTRQLHSLPLNPVALAHVRRVWSDRERLLPGFEPRTVHRELIELQERAGIAEPRFGLHTFRKTCASVFHEIGGRDLAAWVLGHSIPGVTAAYYINPEKRLRKSVDEMPQPAAFRAILSDPARQGSVVLALQAASRRAGWRFERRAAFYREEEVPLGPKPLAVLRALVAAGRPLSSGELRRVVWWDRPKVSPTTIKTTIFQARAALQRSIDLPRDWDPLPARRDAWCLYLPTAEG